MLILACENSEYGEIVLRSGTAGYEIIVDGQFLMSSASGGSSVALVEYGMDGIIDRKDLKVLIAGLGLGFSLRTALQYEQVTGVTVVELSAIIVDWHYRDLIANAKEEITDRRVNVVNQDFIQYITSCLNQFDLIAIDIDNGPEWLSHEVNRMLYTAEYLNKIKHCLTPGGVVTFWSASPSPELQLVLSGIFAKVTEMAYDDHNGEGRLIQAYIYKAN